MSKIMIEWVGFEEFAKVNKNALTPGSVRILALKRHKNGATYFIRKVGKRLLFSQKKFEEWVDKGKR